MTLQIGKVLELEDVDNGLDDYRSTSNLTFEQYRYYLFKEVRKKAFINASQMELLSKKYATLL